MSRSDQKRIVVLTGAGAAIPFGGPSTDDITEALAEDYRFVGGNNAMPLGEYLLTHMRQHFANEHLHFETLIDVAEELSTRLRDKIGRNSGEHQLTSTFISDINPDIFDRVLDYESLYEKEREWYYSDPGRGICHATSINGVMDPKRSLVRNLLQHWLDLVIDEVKTYVNNCADHPLASCYRELLETLSREGIVRHYTLNYDRLAAEVEPSGMNIFDGFDGEAIQDEDGSDCWVANPQRVRRDRNTDCAYNLHGSIRFAERAFEEEGNVTSGRRTLEWVRNDDANYPHNGRSPESISTTQEDRVVTNIVTGRQKPDRMLMEPQRAFYQSFGMDSAEADIFLVVGYSFSDPHVNALLEERMNRREGTEMWFVGYDSEAKKKFDQVGYLGPMDSVGLKQDGILPSKLPITSNHVDYNLPWIRSTDRRLAATIHGFDHFLENRTWEALL